MSEKTQEKVTTAADLNQNPALKFLTLLVVLNNQGQKHALVGYCYF